MPRFYSGIQAILFITLLTGFAASDCQGQLYTLRAEVVEVEALEQVEMSIFLDVHTPSDPAVPASQVAAIQFGLSYQTQLSLECVNTGVGFGGGEFLVNSQDPMSLFCVVQDSDNDAFTPITSPGERDAVFMLTAWDGNGSPVYFSGMNNELAVLTFKSNGKAGSFPISFVGDLEVGLLGPVLVTVVDAGGINDHFENLPLNDPEVVTENGNVLVRPSPVSDFVCDVIDECSCEVMMSWVNGEAYETLELYENNTDPGNLVELFADPLTIVFTTVQMNPMTSYLLVGTSNGVGSAPVSCTIISSCSIPDLESPVIETMRDIEAFASGTACEAMVTWTDPTVTDNCPGATVSCVPVSGSNFTLGTNLVTCTAIDASGNTSVETFDVTVKDVGLPTVTAPAPVSAECTGTTGQVIAIGTATATDICDTAPVITNDAPALFSLGATTVTWTATDASGNFATA
ncbi:MAG: HYR domain-containing protein, partial [Planctomycetes bacterium]|nr:HYR domain-containing protein [Planctomycetota bacterium]